MGKTLPFQEIHDHDVVTNRFLLTRPMPQLYGEKPARARGEFDDTMTGLRQTANGIR
jgi:hypothetical protein